MNRLVPSAAAAVLFTISGTLSADVLHLRSGGRVEGDVVSSGDGSETNYYLVKTDAGTKLKIAKSQVEHIERKSEAELNYERFLKKMPDTVEGHWTMSEWCRKNGLSRQREIHLEEIIKRSPDHEEARHGLGYSRLEGDGWVKMDEWNMEHGYVRHEGRWKPRQVVALEEAARKWELAQKQWRKDLKMWRKWIDRGGRRTAEAVQKFREIDEPAAAMGLADLLEEETSSGLKKLYIEILGRLNISQARTALVKASIEDPDVSVRGACLQELQKQDHARHVLTPVYIRALDPKKQPDNTKINRAAEALSWLKDESAIPYLIEALVTEHKSKPRSSGGGSPISVSGNGGLSVGGKPKVTVYHIPNEGVRAALRSLTEVDHGFDKEAWLQWYVHDNTPDNIQLRRAD